jgi:tRNA uridine 5-carbamoylmethylation protein Kti12
MVTFGGQMSVTDRISLISSILSLVGVVIIGLISALPNIRRVRAQNKKELSEAQNNLADAFEIVSKEMKITHVDLLKSFAEVQRLTKENAEKDAIIEEQRELIKDQYEQIEFLNTRVRGLISWILGLMKELKEQGVKFSEPEASLLDTGPLNKRKV